MATIQGLLPKYLRFRESSNGACHGDLGTNLSQFGSLMMHFNMQFQYYLLQSMMYVGYGLDQSIGHHLSSVSDQLKLGDTSIIISSFV